MPIYLTPDRFHPNDAKQEHTFATAQVVRTFSYTGVPVSYMALDYSPTSKEDPAFQKLYSYKGPRNLNVVGLNELKNIKFGFGLSRKGDHTWFFSEGYVYEAYWDKIGIEIFEKRSIQELNPPSLKYLELPYKSFGSESESIIWPQHWQWDDAENHQPVNYDIRVIVFKGDSLCRLKSILAGHQYPISAPLNLFTQ